MTRSFVLGIDCKIYIYNQDRSTTPPQNGYNGSMAGNYTEFTTAQDVTLNLSASTADLTNRSSNGWRQVVSALKEASVDFSVLWMPDEPLFIDLLNVYLSQCPQAFLILDGPSTGIATGEGRCEEDGVSTGLHADFVVTSFTRNEALEDGVTADVTIEPAVGKIYPEWVVVEPS